ncbi:Alpha/Beta hydrolase fold [Phytophthora cactorum]|nr:Alpha/Beta hydrolase fold [Phytophthora cactorum]
MFLSKFVVTLLTLPALVANAADCKLGPSEKCAVDSLQTPGDDVVLLFTLVVTRAVLLTTTPTTPRRSRQVRLFPNQKQDKSKVLLYFQGGGACVDKDTCNFALQCQLGAHSLITTTAKVDNSGIMDRGGDGNPFKDWNVVFLPYCTGDLFVGNTQLEASESAYNQALGNKQCLGQNRSMHLSGYNNAKAVLDWALENFPDPKQLVVGGYSAGSLSAQLWSAKIADMWQVEQKSTKFQVLADSYVGVFPEHKAAASSLVNFYGGCDVDLHFPESLAAECKAGTASATALVDALIKDTPKSEWLFIDSTADRTQRKFYELVRLGIAGYPFTTLLDAGEFYGNLTQILDSHAQLTSVTRFNIDSEQHVWLKSAGYATATSVDGAVLGNVLSEWLGASSTNATFLSTNSAGMALHRKQRGFVDASPQYVRIPASHASSRAVGYSLHEAHPRAQRVFAKRYAAGDRSRKISSLQLRACFVLCVLLYFGAIYFADDIANIGRVVGSEQSSQNFFVHSLRPRGRGNMRVGRAVDAKKVEATTAPPLTTVALGEQNPHESDDPPTAVPDVETQTEVAIAETEEAQATEPLEQPETERDAEAMHQDAQKAIDDAPGDAVHPDDQGEDFPAGQAENAKPAQPVQGKYNEQVKTISADLINKPNDGNLETRKREQEGLISAAPKKFISPARDQPHPTAAVRHPEKGDDAVAVPAASLSRVKEQQHIRSNVEPANQTDRNDKPSEEARPVVEQRKGKKHQQPTATPA